MLEPRVTFFVTNNFLKANPKYHLKNYDSVYFKMVDIVKIRERLADTSNISNMEKLLGEKESEC